MFSGPFKLICPCYKLEYIGIHFLHKKVTNDNIKYFSGSIGAKYSYSCLEDGFVIDMPGYPEEILVECDFPPGYHSNNWVHELWKSGVWTNFGNITKCIDPNRSVGFFTNSYAFFRDTFIFCYFCLCLVVTAVCLLL